MNIILFGVGVLYLCWSKVCVSEKGGMFLVVCLCAYFG